ncbi:MAG: hypothetical protein K2G55_00200 [Lachnospiraceae bacterium]|nr:hypothetical protein [Lachnospiraceae bacterium]MDE7201505.1 hypothetical protein [Lachnospiraceae bacterium]
MSDVTQPREPIFYPNEMSVSIERADNEKNTLKTVENTLNKEPVNKHSLKETMDKFNENNQNFICTEALKIFYRTQSEEIALRALELLERVAQPF